MREYLVIYERAEHNWAAYSPDVPGCIATGQTRQEVEENYRDALAFHLEGLQAEGLPVPEPVSDAGRIRARAWGGFTGMQLSCRCGSRSAEVNADRIASRQAKFWLDPVQAAANHGFSGRELNEVERLVREHRIQLLEAWNDYFG